MNETPYAAEDILQALLERHPDLLAGGQMTPDSPRRWALIAREQLVPDSDSSSGRWSLDHLFVDQDGVPTLVEVKRSTDTRIRREVVGQMFDYAANAVVYLPIEQLRGWWEDRVRAQGMDAAATLAEVLGVDDPEAFWLSARTNLQAGRIRL